MSIVSLDSKNILIVDMFNSMEKKLFVIASRILEIFMVVMGILSFLKKDWLWVFACLFAFLISISPIIIKRNANFSVHWLIEFLLVFTISLHVWGGVLNLYSYPFYDKIAHFIASAVVAFFALIIVYVLDVFSPRVHMDLVTLGFFITIFTIAMGAVWEIAEFTTDTLFSGGKPVAQISLKNTMWDMIADTFAGILVGIAGAIGIRKGEFKDIILYLTNETKKSKFGAKFIDARNKALSSLQNAIMKGEVDEKALPIIEKINSMADFFTTSSCSGRIVIMEIPSFGRKREAKNLGKWHRKVKIEEIREALSKASKGEIWFFVQSPIFHVSTVSMENAKKLLDLAIQSGFKNSSIKTLNGRIVVEILGTERIDAPLGKDGKIYVDFEYIEILISIANKMIARVDRNLKRIEKNINKTVK